MSGVANHPSWQSNPHRWRLAADAGVWLVVLAALVGCTGGKPPRADIVVGMESAPSGFDPRKGADAYASRINRLLYRGLTQIGPDATVKGDLALRWNYLSPTHLHLELDPNARFHNGNSVTSQDVVYTLKSILDPATGSPHAETLMGIADVTAPTPQDVHITLREPLAPLLTALAVGILPKEYADPDRNPVGSGEYKFVRQQHEQYYFEAFHPAEQGAKTIEFRVLPNDATRSLALERGDIDLLQNSIPPEDVERFRANPDIEVTTAASNNTNYLGFNLGDPIVGNKLVRKAIAHAIDRPEIIRTFLAGMAQPADSLLPPFHWAYAATGSAYTYDPDLAQKLLDQAGFPRKSKDKPRLTIEYKTSTNKLRIRIAEAVAGYLERVGVHVELRTLDFATFFEDIRNGRFQMYSLAWVGITEPDIFFYAFHSASAPPGGANRGRYSNPQFDVLAASARHALDNESRRPLYEQVQRIVADDLPVIPLWHEDNVVALRHPWTGYRIYPGGDFRALAELRRLQTPGSAPAR